jgi:four helix bundle protein
MKNANADPRGPGAKPPKDIVVRTFNFAVSVIQRCVELDDRRGVGRILLRQMLRAGTSVPANVEEAQAAQSKADFVSKMRIALKEARETSLPLRLLIPAKVIPPNDLKPLIQEADEIQRVIGAIIVSAKRGGVN